MDTLTDTVLSAAAMLLMAAVLLLVSRLRRKSLRPPASQVPESRAVQKFFAEVAAGEKLFGVGQRKDSVEDRSRKAAQVREIEALLASAEFRALTEEQQEMRVKLLADESVVRLIDHAKCHSQENERLILELKAKRDKEAIEFRELQKQRDADIARLGELERAATYRRDDKALLAEIDALKRKMAMAKYVGARTPDT